jgi:small subunit ribosomal protein S16
MLKMRLQRIGRKNQPAYRVVVTDSRNAQVRGRSVDIVGSYEPRSGKFEIDAEKAKKWLSQGVQPSDTIYNFLVGKKIIEGRKKNVLPKKSPVIDEAKLKAEAEAKAKAEADAKAKAEADAKAKEEAEATPATTEETPVAA